MDINGAEDVRNLKNKLEYLQGVVDVRVSPSDSVVRVEFDSSTVGIRNVLKSIKVQISIFNAPKLSLFHSLYPDCQAVPLICTTNKRALPIRYVCVCVCVRERECKLYHIPEI